MSFVNWFQKLFFGIWAGTIFQEIIDLCDFFSHFHHTNITDFFHCLCSTPFEIFSQVDNCRMERKSKQKLFFQTVIDFLDDKTVFRNIRTKLQFFHIVLQKVLCQFFHFCQIYKLFISYVHWGCIFSYWRVDIRLAHVLLIFFNDIQSVISFTHIDKRFTCDLTSIFFGEF